MRRFDKKKNIQKANLLAEQRYLKSKEAITEGINENEVNEYSWRDSYNDFEPNYKVKSVENEGFDTDNYPQYSFETEYGGGLVSSLKILKELAGWELTSGCESKNPSIVKICNDIYKKLEDYYIYLPKTNEKYGDKEYEVLTKEARIKYDELERKLFSHDLVTKIIETELNMTLPEAIEKLLSKGIIDDRE